MLLTASHTFSQSLESSLSITVCRVASGSVRSVRFSDSKYSIVAMADSSEAGTGAMSGDRDVVRLQGIADRAGATNKLLGLPRRFTFSSLGAETILRVLLVQTEPFLLRSGAEALRLRRAM